MSSDLLQGETISTAGLAAPGMILLVTGLVVIAFNGQAASSRRKLEAKHQQGESLTLMNRHIPGICKDGARVDDVFAWSHGGSACHYQTRVNTFNPRLGKVFEYRQKCSVA